MRFLLLTPGTGHFFCGSCLRDNALAVALRRLGHEVDVLPLYLPLVLEEPDGDPRVRMGGINMYLQQKSRLARWLPRPLANALDRPGLLRMAARRAKLTEAHDLGAMTVSMLRGPEGRQAHEVRKLVDAAAALPRPDVVVLSNLMLAGLARPLRETLGRPVVTTLQGEAPFLDGLPQSFRDDAWQVLRAQTTAIDALVPVSHSYGRVMQERLGVPAAQLYPVRNGIALDDFAAAPPPLATRRPPTVGYLARMCADKGLPVLVEAFLHLVRRGRVPGVRLRAAGVMLREDEPVVESVRRRLATELPDVSVEFLPNLQRSDKLEALRSFSVLSVPALYGESFGLYVLEALAAGVPVVQPDCGAFPELLEATGGGVLCPPGDAAALAVGLEELLVDGERAQACADRGRAAVLAEFDAMRMAREFAAVCGVVA
ncbi:MAG: glycosyltransferase family 4 protein, partial [Planctomycetes bacterium]|nr:glycosyltransferase family 4 protein [Planctomycetota bacterium]